MKSLLHYMLTNLDANLKVKNNRGSWVVQLVKRPTSAQVMTLQFVSSSSVLTAQSLEPVSDSVSPSPSAPPLFTLCLKKRGAWVAQSVKRPTSARSRFRGP